MNLSYTKFFNKDLKLAEKRGKNIEKLKNIIELLINEVTLLLKHKDHQFIDNFIKRRECHIEPDWLLIYKLEKDKRRIIFERTGTHSDLFRSFI